MNDIINSPAHYEHPSGVECKEITYDLPTWLGTAIKYVWRCDNKGKPVEDRRKALACLRDRNRLRMLNTYYTDTPAGYLNKLPKVYMHKDCTDTLHELLVGVHLLLTKLPEKQDPEVLIDSVHILFNGVEHRLEEEISTLEDIYEEQ